MGVQIDNGQDTGLGLEPEHTLVIGLILPSTAVNEIDTFVGLNVVSVNVTSNEDVWDFLDDQSVLWLGR